MDLFDHALQRNPAHQPLAERVRPTSMNDIIGQDEALGPQSALGRMLKQGRLPSLILWGPPGTGKTTLARAIAGEVNARFVPFSAVSGGVPALRQHIASAQEQRKLLGESTILFVDEIHRFNKAQQDALLPHVENGDLILIGATTENPSFAINAALLSRTRVVALRELDHAALLLILSRALTHPRGVTEGVRPSDAIMKKLAIAADHDARRALGLLEEWMWSGAEDWEAFAAASLVKHDRAGEAHYNVVSALIKSMRGSDPDASIYWMMRMVEGGEDPRFISRRLLIFASEDIGLADPRALQVAVATDHAVLRLGMPECLHALAECTLYLALAPKSNSAYRAFSAAKEVIAQSGSLPTPMHLRNAATTAMKDWGYGKGYRYPHDEGGYAPGVNYLPEELLGVRFYEQGQHGFEGRIRRGEARGGSPAKESTSD